MLSASAPAGWPPSRNAPCPCGSGKRYKNCCGDLHTPATPLSYTRDRLQQDLSAALTAERLRDWEGAAAHAHAVLDKVPHQRQALRILCRCKTELRDYAGARVLMQRLLRHFPHDPEINADAAELNELLGDVAGALEMAHKTIRLNANESRAHRLLGRVAMRHGDIGAAEVHLRQALYNEPGSSSAAADLARVLGDMGFKSEAEHYYRVSLSLEPRQPATLMAWAAMEESRHELPRARQLLVRAAALEPRHPLLPLSEAAILCREKRFREALSSLRDVDRKRLTVADQARLFFLRGRVRDRLRRYEDAFGDFERANELSRRWLSLRYDADAHRRRADDLRRFFTAAGAAGLPRAEPPADEAKPRPVFIVGFPRSGSSIVLRSVTMHREFVGGDELFCVPNVRDRAARLLGAGSAYPECLAALENQPENIYRLRREYWSMLEQAGVMEPGAAYFVDRLPLNEWELGLIHLILPEARFIEIVRHPLDAVLSLFAGDVRHGGLCGFDLEHAARHYALTRELVAHYRANLPVEILTVRYEDLVADFEPAMRRVIEYAGAQWSPDCLHFQDNPAPVRSASYADLAEPLFNDRVYRHRHYTAAIKPVAPILEPWVRELGYGLD